MVEALPRALVVFRPVGRMSTPARSHALEVADDLPVGDPAISSASYMLPAKAGASSWSRYAIRKSTSSSDVVFISTWNRSSAPVK